MLRQAFLSALVTFASTAQLLAAEDKALIGRESVTTAKERLINKASDPQRVNDCKVPTAKRDATQSRTDSCSHLEQKGETKASGSEG